MERENFQKKLMGLGELAKKKGNSLTREEIQSFLAELSLNEEQLQMVYEYLAASHITVKGYVAQEPKEEIPYTPEEEKFLAAYREDLEAFQRMDKNALRDLLLRAEAGDDLARAQVTEQYLPRVLELAEEFRGQGMSLDDLVQEGNIGLLLALENLKLRSGELTPEEYLDGEIRITLREALEESISVRRNGDEMADKVNSLSDSIRQLTDDMDRQVSIEELSAFLDMDVEEIRDILKLAGDDVELDEADSEEAGLSLDDITVLNAEDVIDLKEED